MSENNYCPFWPQSIGPYELDLNAFVALFCQAENAEQQLDVVEKHLRLIPVHANAQEGRLRYQAFLLVLADLIRQQWQSEIRQGKLYLRPPNWSTEASGEAEIQVRKQILRQSLMWERNSQFERDSVKKFIRYMEQERSFSNQTVSIRSLLAEAPVLARQLQTIVELEDEETQKEQIQLIIQPYLQLIKAGVRCAYTGFYLQDIWRYFRYTWSTPYHSTPGRQMFYLVRDAARPYHPVIGIAALGSSMVQLSVRDDAIGWTPKAVENRLKSPQFDDAQATQFTQMLRQTLHDVIDDLVTRDLVEPAELDHPTSSTLQHLAMIEQENKKQRVDLLRRVHGQDRVVPALPLFDLATGDTSSQPLTGSPNLFDAAQDCLYRAKRAGVLRQLLQALQALEHAAQPLETAAGLCAFWQTSVGRQAIKTLIRENKKRKVGINMMDIIVCGALPPYNILLGGKLVAMLLASPQIVRDYQEKYSSYASTIASRMKGKEVQRDSQLAFLGTTSLYASGNSQYNRIVIPLPGPGTPREEMRYIRYGLTEGYGSVHFSEETVAALTALQEHVQEARLINNRFGEGVNPKLRRVRAGLASIGLLSVDHFLRHRSQRIVYGLPLGRSSYDFLRGEIANLDYYFDSTSEVGISASTTYICRHWATRWLLSRIQNPKFIERVSAFRPEDILLSREVSTFMKKGFPLEDAIT